MNVFECINKNHSVLGQDIVDWINNPNKPDNETDIANMIYNKYMIDREGNPRNKIFSNVYYYINYNLHYYTHSYVAYIVRDKLKSPRKIPESLASLNIVNSGESYKGSLICEWAYYQNSSSDKQYYMDGCDIVTKYLEGRHPIKHNIYYFVNRTSRGIRIFRDLEKSPRLNKAESGENNGTSTFTGEWRIKKSGKTWNFRRYS